jgi:hypothetical protein
MKNRLPVEVKTAGDTDSPIITRPFSINDSKKEVVGQFRVQTSVCVFISSLRLNSKLKLTHCIKGLSYGNAHYLSGRFN